MVDIQGKATFACASERESVRAYMRGVRSVLVGEIGDFICLVSSTHHILCNEIVEINSKAEEERK